MTSGRAIRVCGYEPIASTSDWMARCPRFRFRSATPVPRCRTSVRQDRPGPPAAPPGPSRDQIVGRVHETDMAECLRENCRAAFARRGRTLPQATRGRCAATADVRTALPLNPAGPSSSARRRARSCRRGTCLRPFSSVPRRAAKQASESNRGRQSQSMEPSRATSAQESILPMKP